MKKSRGDVNASKVAFASRNEAVIYEAISQMGGNVDAETANKLIKNYNPKSGISAQVYARGMLQAYTYGFYGINKANTMGKNTPPRELTNEQRNYAYGLGVEYGRKKAAQDQAAVKEQKKTTQEGGVVHSFKGYADDGKGIYESNFPLGTPKRAKGERILKYIQDVWSKKPITLKIEDDSGVRYIEAKFWKVC